MDRKRSHRIVKLEPVEKEHRQYHDDSGDGSDDDGGGDADAIRPCRDSDEPGETPVQCHGKVGLFQDEHARKHCRHDSCGGAERRCDQHIGDHSRIGVQDGAAVESEPAEPEHEHPDRRQRHAVSHDGHAVPVHEFADARSEQNHSGEGSPAADTVDKGRSGEVMKFHLVEESASPSPGPDHRVDHRHIDQGEDQK